MIHMMKTSLALALFSCGLTFLSGGVQAQDGVKGEHTQEQFQDITSASQIQNINETDLRKGLNEFENLKNVSETRRIARQAAQAAVHANIEAQQYKHSPGVNGSRNAKSDWAKALSLSNASINHVIDNANINFGIDSSAQRKLDRAVMHDVKSKRLDGPLPEMMKAVDYGQDLIGEETLDGYMLRWQEQIAAQVRSNNGKRVNCKVFSNNESVSVVGRDCMPNYAFERIEARADASGKLSSVMLVEQLSDDVSEDDVIYYLEERYQNFDIAKSKVSEVATLEKDLCNLMTNLVKDRYVCDVRWYANNDNYVIYKYSNYGGVRRAIYMHGSEEFITNTESKMVKRRLALIRQDVSQQDLQYNHLIKNGASNDKVIPNEPSAIISNKETINSVGIRTSL